MCLAIQYLTALFAMLFASLVALLNCLLLVYKFELWLEGGNNWGVSLIIALSTCPNLTLPLPVGEEDGC